MPTLDYLILIITVIIIAISYDFFARYVFSTRGSYSVCKQRRKDTNRKRWQNRNYIYYNRSDWTFLQRLFWIPVFKAPFEPFFRIMACLVYLQYFLAFIPTVWITLTYLYFQKSQSFIWSYFLFVAFSICSFALIDHIRRLYKKKT